MKWLNFMPLVIFAIGFAAVCSWSEHLMVIDGRRDEVNEAGDAGAKVWLAGCAVLLFIGVGLSI